LTQNSVGWYATLKGSNKVKNRKWLIISVLAALMPAGAFAQSQSFDFGRFSLFSSSKILENGFDTDVGLGYAYADRFAGELRLRFSGESKIEQFDETVPDSLNAMSKNAFALFLTPLEYFFVRDPNGRLHVGAGAFYQHETLAENGYFNMPALEALGKEKVNSFSNDFSTHTLGPNIEAGFTRKTAWLEASIRGGVVPVFWLHTNQETRIDPLMEPNYADYSKDTWGSPYLYGDLNMIFFRFISLSLLYDFSRLQYQVIDFDSNLQWHKPDRTVLSQSVKLEASLLIPLPSSVYAQIGYGYAFDTVQLDSGDPVGSDKHYLIFTVNKKD
jgi:hypothetical protein